MNFLENIFSRLDHAAGRVLLAEAHAGGDRTATGAELLAQIAAARAFLRAAGLAKGDRCALIAPNSIRWAALDLAILAEGLVAVPLYARQEPAELVAMMRDAGVGLVCCGDPALRDSIATAWADAPRFALFDDIFGTPASAFLPPPADLSHNTSWPSFTLREPLVRPRA
jgi:long-subunit acyl-CoA synthetase (AMP-forming)